MAAERLTNRWGDDFQASASLGAAPAREGRRLLALTLCAGVVLGGTLAICAWRPRSSDAQARPNARPVRALARSTPPSRTGTPARLAPPDGQEYNRQTEGAGRDRTPQQLVAEAKRLAERVRKILPDSPQALVLAGRIYYAFNDVSQAEACWQTCLQQHPGFDEPRCALAEAAWEHGDFERAVEQLSPLVAANPRLDQKQVFFFADALLNLGRPAEAAAALERTAAYAALPPFGLFLLAHARLECGEYERARQQFEAVLAANPQSANAHFGLATVYTRLGQTDQARQHRERYAQLRSDELADSARLRPEMRKADWADPIPVLRESYLNAGKVCAAEARLVDAEKFWLRAAELDPRSPRPRQLLELLYAGQGRHAEAARMKTLGLAESR